MNLKLSTAAALAINAISKTGGADSKAVLTEKVASSYEQHTIGFGIGSAGRKRILQDSRGLQAHIKKDDATGGSAVDSALESSAGNSKTGDGVNNLPNSDVGILGLRAAMGRRTLQNSNVQPKKRDAGLLAKMITKRKDLDVGVLGKAKGRTSLVPGRLLQSNGTVVEVISSCVTGGGSYTHCLCEAADLLCSTIDDSSSYSLTYCPFSDCCQSQTDDEGKYKCFNYSETNGTSSEINGTDNTEIYASIADLQYQFAQCKTNSSDFECTCKIYAPYYCKFGFCGYQICCNSYTDEAGILNCVDNLYGASNGTDYTETDIYDQFAQCLTNSSDIECTCKILAPIYCTSGYCDTQICCNSYTVEAGLVDCVANAYYGKCIAIGSSKYSCLCGISYIKCFSGYDEQQCAIDQCCVDAPDDDGQKICLGLGNSTTATTISSSPTPSPVVATTTTDTQEVTTLPTQEVPNGSNGSIDTPTTPSAPESTTEIPNKPTTNPDGNSAVGSPMSNAAAVESVNWIKSMALSVISLVVVGWFMMV